MRRAFPTLLLFGWTILGLAEQNSSIKFPSPDGRFALRISEDLTIDLVETSGKILIDIGKLYVDRRPRVEKKPS